MTEIGDEESVAYGGGWRIDRHIPIALLVALSLQTGAGFWWAATINANVNAMQGRIEKLETNSLLVISQGQQIAAMDAKMSAMQDSLKELKALVMSLFTPPLKAERPR